MGAVVEIWFNSLIDTFTWGQPHSAMWQTKMQLYERREGEEIRLVGEKSKENKEKEEEKARVRSAPDGSDNYIGVDNVHIPQI